MWRVPLADVRAGDVLFMVGCHRGPWSGPWVQRPLWEPEHAPGSPRTGRRGAEAGSTVEGVSTPRPRLPSCFSDNFFSKYFPQIKRRCSYRWHHLKNWDQPKCQSVYIHRGYSSQACWAPKGTPLTHWAKFTTPFILHVFAIMCNLCSSLVPTFNAK